MTTSAPAADPATSASTPNDPHTADRAALRQMMIQVTDALNQHRWREAEALLDTHVTLVFVDQRAVLEPSGLEPYFARWFSSQGGVASVQFAPDVDRPATFVTPDVAIATGHSRDRYTMQDGRTGEMPSTWTATMVRRTDGWRIAALHCGVDVTDNIILDSQRRGWQQLVVISALVAGFSGLLLGILGRSLIRMRRTKSA